MSGLLRKVRRTSRGKPRKFVVSYESVLFGKVEAEGLTEGEAEKEARARAFREIWAVQKDLRKDLTELQGYERELHARIWEEIHGPRPDPRSGT